MILINIPGIKGSTTVKGHEDWIAVDSFQWGVGRSVEHSKNSGRAAKNVSSPNISEVTFTRGADMASPNLFYESCGGDVIKNTTIEVIEVVKNQPQTIAKITLENVHVSSYSISSGGDNPSESFALNFTKLKYEYGNGNDRAYDFQKTVGE